jgi:hypothetical protein
MLKKPNRFYLAAGAAVIGVLTFAALGQAEARSHGGKHQHFHHFHHRFHAERHFYVVPVVRPRIVKKVKTAPVRWAKKCGDAPAQA